MAPFYALQHVSYSYRRQKQDIPVLRDISLSLNPGEMVALMGPSGSGKSTLLHLAGLLDQPLKGEVILKGQSCKHLSDRERTYQRNHFLGFVYQFHHLLPDFSALENICIPRFLKGDSARQAHAAAAPLLEAVGLSHRASHRPAELSGGEQQRVAIARALANNPDLLIADEPTGNLDEVTSQTVFTLLRTLAREKNLAILMATHNPDLARQMDRTLYLHDSALISP